MQIRVSKIIKQVRIRRLLFPLVFVLGTAAILHLSDSLLDNFTLPNKLQDFITLSLSIFVEAFPFLVLGSLLASLVNTYVPTHMSAIANIIGYVLSLKKREQDFLTDDFVELCEAPKKEKKTTKHRIDTLSSNFTHEAFTMIKLLAGSI